MRRHDPHDPSRIASETTPDPSGPRGLTRRELLLATGAVVAAGALGCEPDAPPPSTPLRVGAGSSGGGAAPSHAGRSSAVPNPAEHAASDPGPVAAAPGRMPTVFLPHGGGPWPFMDDAVWGAAGMWDAMRAYMEALRMVPPRTPQAVLLVSAHWEAEVPTVQTAAQPPMLYDYYGFPDETYEIEWPAPGAPEVAAEVRSVLENAGFVTAEDAARGFDHGVFVPMMLGWPGADIPTFQLSLKAGLDPAEHLAMGRALEPLRNSDVFIVGSGMSYHNLKMLIGSRRGRGGTMADDSRAFDDWLAASMTADPARRTQALVEWEQAPRARASHPREEHLLPLMVVAGAAGEDAGELPYRDVVMGASVSAVHFG